MEQVLIISSVLLWIGLLFNFLLILALIRRASQPLVQNQEALKPGTNAPPFEAMTLDGMPINQDHYKGIDAGYLFLGIDCQPCAELMRHIDKLVSVVKSKGVELMIVSDAPQESMRGYLKKYDVELQVLIAQKEKFMVPYMIVGTPSYCLVDSQGVVRAAGHPGQEGELFREQILKLKGDLIVE